MKWFRKFFSRLGLTITLLSLLSFSIYINAIEAQNIRPLFLICSTPINTPTKELLIRSKEIGFNSGLSLFKRHHVDYYLRQNGKTLSSNFEQFALFENGYIVFSYSQILPFYDEHCVIRSHHGRITMVNLQDSI